MTSLHSDLLTESNWDSFLKKVAHALDIPPFKGVNLVMKPTPFTNTFYLTPPISVLANMKRTSDTNAPQFNDLRITLLHSNPTSPVFDQIQAGTHHSNELSPVYAVHGVNEAVKKVFDIFRQTFISGEFPTEPIHQTPLFEPHFRGYDHHQSPEFEPHFRDYDPSDDHHFSYKNMSRRGETWGGSRYNTSEYYDDDDD